MFDLLVCEPSFYPHFNPPRSARISFFLLCNSISLACIVGISTNNSIPWISRFIYLSVGNQIRTRDCENIEGKKRQREREKVEKINARLIAGDFKLLYSPYEIQLTIQVKQKLAEFRLFRRKDNKSIAFGSSVSKGDIATALIVWHTFKMCYAERAGKIKQANRCNTVSACLLHTRL